MLKKQPQQKSASFVAARIRSASSHTIEEKDLTPEESLSDVLTKSQNHLRPSEDETQSSPHADATSLYSKKGKLFTEKSTADNDLSTQDDSRVDMDLSGSYESPRQLGKCCCLCALIKRHPVYSALIISATFSAILTMILIAAYKMVPSIIEHAINTSVLELQEAKLTEPKAYSVNLSVTTKLSRRYPQKVEIAPFRVEIYLIPMKNVSNHFSQVEDGKQHKLSDINAHDETLSRDLIRRRLLQENMVKSLGRCMARMDFPGETLAGKRQNITYVTTLHVLEPAEFSEMSREFIRSGQTLWVLSGDISVRLFGISMGPLTYKKYILVRGLDIRLKKFNFGELDSEKESKLNDQSIRMAVEKDRLTVPTIVEYLKAVSPEDSTIIYSSLVAPSRKESFMTLQVQSLAFAPQGANEEPQEYLPVSASPLDVGSISEDVSFPGLHLKTHVVIANANKSITIDPVGVISFLFLYNEVPIVTMMSRDAFSLVPGKMHLEFEGSIRPLQSLEKLHRQAITQFIRALIVHNPINITIRGHDCSVGLYKPAIQAIEIVYPLIPSQPPQPEDSLSLTSSVKRIAEDSDSLPFFVGFRLLKLKTNFSPKTEQTVASAGAYYFGLEGALQLSIKNPFQYHMQFRPMAIHGTLYFHEAFNNSLLRLGSFSGTLLESQDVLSKSVAETPSPTQRKLDPSEKLLMNILHWSYDSYVFAFDLNFDIDTEAFVQLIRSMINTKNPVKFTLKKVRCDIQMIIPIGLLDVIENVTLSEYALLVESMNFLDNIALVSFGTSRIDNVMMSLRERSGIKLFTVIALTSRSIIEADLGRLTVALYYRGDHIAYMSAENCTLREGVNIFNFTGAIRFLELQRPATAFVLLTRHLAGVENDIEVEFVGSKTVDLANSSAIWVQHALDGYTFTITLPGYSAFNKITATSEEVSAADLPQDSTTAAPMNLFQKLFANGLSLAGELFGRPTD